MYQVGEHAQLNDSVRVAHQSRDDCVILLPTTLSQLSGPGTYSPKAAAAHGVELPQSFGGRTKHIIETDEKPSFKPLNRDKELERSCREVENGMKMI